jgi:hypothetical protein
MLGVMANNLLPARLGEFVRAYMAGKDAGIREAGVLSSIVVERTLDVFWLFAFLSTAFVFPFEATWPVRLAGLTFCVLLGASAFICFSIWKGRQLSRWLVSLPLGKKTGRLQGWLTNHFEAFLQVMSATGSLKSVLQFLAYSMACWIVWAGFLLCILFSFNIEIPFTGLFLLTGIINLAVLIPSAPGYIGPYQFACIMGLGLFGIPKEEALAFSLALHASWYIPSTLVGMIFLVRLGLSFSQIMDMETGTSQGILG